ncbi:MAG: dihydroneopterin aldolase [Chloroflexi bacterium]|nr:dihydroneopterin aldolase [Chloroflexota bacterium]
MAGDIIRLEGMVFYGYHGVTTAEREAGQRFIVDVEVETNLTAAGESDSLQDTVDYTRLFHIVKRVIEGPSRNLLESLAQAIAQETLQSFPVNAVAVKITKPHVPIKGSILTGASVEISRHREG